MGVIREAVPPWVPMCMHMSLQSVIENSVVERVAWGERNPFDVGSCLLARVMWS